MKIKQIFAVLAVSASLMSCNFLDEFDPNATTAGNFYTSEADHRNLAQRGLSVARAELLLPVQLLFHRRAGTRDRRDRQRSQQRHSLSVLQLYAHRGEPVRLQPLYAAVQKAFRESIRCFPTSTT